MNSIQQLVSHLQQSNLKTPSEDAQESVIKTLDTALSKKEYPSGQAPPLDIIIYALNNILYPTFLPELMSEFLHLFTMLEFYRRRIIEKAALTIEMNTFYRSASDANVVLLDDEDELFLRNLVDEQKDVRRIFIKVVEQCCIVDLERLWLTSSNVDFWVRWNEYLSILNDHNDGASPHSFHFNLSADELDHFERVILQVADFMNSTIDAGQQLRRKGKSIHDTITDKDFQRIHAPSEMNPKLRKAIGYHQRYTQKIVQRFNIIAPKMSQSV